MTPRTPPIAQRFVRGMRGFLTHHPLRHPETGKIMSQTAGQIAQITKRLSDAGEEVLAAEARLRSVSLAAALSDDPAGTAADAQAALSQARQKQEVLSLALSQAKVEHEEHLDGLSTKERRANERAIRAQLGILLKAAEDCSAAQARVRDSARKAYTAAEAIRSLLPSHLRGAAAGYENQLTGGYVRQLLDCEAYRLSQGGPAAPGADKLPARWGTFLDAPTGTVPSLATILAGLADLIKSKLSSEILEPAPSSTGFETGEAGPVPPTPNPIEEVRHSSSVSDGAQERGQASTAAPPEVLPHLDLGLDLRGVDFGIPKGTPMELQDEGEAPAAPGVAPDLQTPTVARPRGPLMT
jgi:hypothetical protein